MVIYGNHQRARPSVDADIMAQLVPGPSRRRQLVVGLAVLGAVFFLLVAQRDEFRDPYNDWRHTLSLEGEVRELHAPIGYRSQANTVALGDGRVLIWGGRAVSADSGQIYDPAADTWEHLPVPPGPARFGAAAAWTGKEAVIWGGATSIRGGGPLDPGGIAFDPSTATWRSLPPAPLGLVHPRAVVAGNGVLIAGGRSSMGEPPTSLWLDLDLDTWTVVPAPVAVVSMVVDGDRVLATGPPTLQRGGSQPRTGWSVVAFDTARLEWKQVTASIDTEWMALAVDDGTITAVTLEGLNDPLRAYEWTGREWDKVRESKRAASGMSAIEIVGYPPVTVWTDDRLLMGGDGGFASWDPSARRFARFTDQRLRSFGGSAVWNGSAAVLLSSQSSKGWVWEPAAGE